MGLIEKLKEKLSTKKGNVNSTMAFLFLIMVIGICAISLVMFALLMEKFVQLAPTILGANASASFNTTSGNAQTLLSTTSSIAILFVVGVVGALVIGALVAGVMFVIYSVGGRGGGATSAR